MSASYPDPFDLDPVTDADSMEAGTARSGGTVIGEIHDWLSAIQDDLTGTTGDAVKGPDHNSLAERLDYIEAAATGQRWKDSVRARTRTAGLSGTWTYNNGAGTLTRSAPGALAAVDVDGVTLVATDRLLVASAGTGYGATAYGIYTVTTVGDGSTATVLTRSTDADTGAELDAAAVFVEPGGTSFGSTQWVQTVNNPTLGTTAMAWVQLGGGGSSYTVDNDTIEAPGNQLKVKTIDGDQVRVGTLPINRIEATETPSNTTFLRGDGQWRTPTGGAGTDDRIWPTASPYNATGNGTTDDTAALHAARDAAGTGGHVYLRAGTYLVTGDGLRLTVAGQRWQLHPAATIKLRTRGTKLTGITGSGSTFTSSTAHGLAVGDRVKFASITGGGGSINTTTAYYVKTAPTTTTFTIATVSATGTTVSLSSALTAATLIPDGDAVTVTADNITITGGTINANTTGPTNSRGVHVTGATFTLDSVTVTKTGDNGVNIIGADGATVKGCTITDTWSNGIYGQSTTGGVDPAERLLIADNYIDRFTIDPATAEGSCIKVHGDKWYNEVQQVYVAAASGTWTLTYGGSTTSALVLDATATQVKAALDALTSFTTPNPDGVAEVAINDRSLTTQSSVTATSGSATLTRSGGLTNIAPGRVVKFTSISGISTLSTGVEYYVTAATATTFQVSATRGGTAITHTVTGAGTCAVTPIDRGWKVTFHGYFEAPTGANPDTLTINSGGLVAFAGGSVTASVSVTTAFGSNDNPYDNVTIARNHCRSPIAPVQDGTICIEVWGNMGRCSLTGNRTMYGAMGISIDWAHGTSCVGNVIYAPNGGVSGGGHGIECAGSRHVTIANNTIDGGGITGETGIVVWDAGGYWPSIKCSVTGNTIRNLRDGCFGIVAQSSASATLYNVNGGGREHTIVGNTIDVQGTDGTQTAQGVRILRASHVVVANNTIDGSGSGSYGVSIQGGEAFIISGNVIRDFTTSGINLNADSGLVPANTAITGNTFLSTTKTVTVSSGFTLGAGVRFTGNTGNVAANTSATVNVRCPAATWDVDDLAAYRIRATGTGAPSIPAGIGSTYTNLSGGATTTFYVKTSGTDGTGWTAK